MTWIKHSEQQPEDGQYVWYYFKVTGVSYGQYDAENDCFYGKSDFLCGDVTHWQPAEAPPSEPTNEAHQPSGVIPYEQ